MELKVALFALTLAVALPALELKPKWKPDLPIDIPRTVKTFAYYTNGKAPFVVFQHGTCVQLEPGSKAPEAEAKVVLDKIYRFHVDFNPLPMDDGNWLISYPKPAYSIVFQDEVKKNMAYIEKHHKARRTSSICAQKSLSSVGLGSFSTSLTPRSPRSADRSKSILRRNVYKTFNNGYTAFPFPP